MCTFNEIRAYAVTFSRLNDFRNLIRQPGSEVAVVRWLISFIVSPNNISVHSPPLSLSQEQHQLPDGLVVAEPGGSVREQRPRVPLHSETWRPGVAEHWHRALGAGHRLVQQHRLERGTPHR